MFDGAERDWNRFFIEAKERLVALGDAYGQLKRRGFSLEEAIRLEMGLSPEGDLIFPILSDRGEVLAHKVRYREPVGKKKYQYLPPGMKTPSYPWHNPNYGQSPGILVVEGELNGMVLYLALEGIFDVVGVAGTHGYLPKSDGRPLFILTDGDNAGRKAALSWQKEIGGRILDPLEEGDACDLAGARGKALLREEVIKRVEKAIKISEPLLGSF